MFNRLKNSVLALSALPSLAYSQMFSFEPDCEKMGSTVVPSPDKMDFSPINHAASTLGNALVSTAQDICQIATTNFMQSPYQFRILILQSNQVKPLAIQQELL